jgi:hypothetical protein
MMDETVRMRLERALAACCAAGILLASLTGCADQLRRRALEDVAKGWCETIRASQVIPVYPLTADLRPGDVFMVQSPIAEQASVYRQRGFLPLDDHRTRLVRPGFGGVYFDGYFKDPFKNPPHDYPSRLAEFFTGTDEQARNKAKASLSAAAAPRAAFPSYSFEVRSGSSGAIALPIQGVPMGMNFLHAQRATGSVTIADARTYAGDAGALLAGLVDWAERPENRRRVLAETARLSRNPVYLRVVSRVYLTGSVVVSLSRSESFGGGADVGKPPVVPAITDGNGEPNTKYAAVLETLNTPKDPVRALSEAGGAVRFTAVSSSSVTMAESFDTLLVIGYLGFDVPVYTGGLLGAPVPTFERLSGRLRERNDFDKADRRLHQQLFALEGMARSGRPEPVRQAAEVVRRVSKAMGKAFDDARANADAALVLPAGDERSAKVLEAFESFDGAARDYVSDDRDGPRRTTLFSDIFDREFWRQVDARP